MLNAEHFLFSKQNAADLGGAHNLIGGVLGGNAAVPAAGVNPVPAPAPAVNPAPAAQPPAVNNEAAAGGAANNPVIRGGAMGGGEGVNYRQPLPPQAPPPLQHNAPPPQVDIQPPPPPGPAPAPHEGGGDQAENNAPDNDGIMEGGVNAANALQGKMWLVYQF